MNVPVRADPLPSWEEYQNRCSLGFASVVPTPWARNVAELYGHDTPVLYHNSLFVRGALSEHHVLRGISCHSFAAAAAGVAVDRIR